MEERLKLFLAMEGLSPSQFADKLGVQRSGVSHLLSGRNKPSFEFISKMLAAYPKINPDWLIMGTGKAYRDMPGGDSQAPVAADPAPQLQPEYFPGPEAQLQEDSVNDDLPSLFSNPEPPKKQEIPAPLPPKPAPEKAVISAKPALQGEKRIAQITIFYTDGTYEVR